MALSRKFLKELLAEYENAADMIDQIVDAHYETVAALKEELKQLQEANGGKTYEEIHAELEAATRELETLKKSNIDDNGISWSSRADEMREKYEAEKEKYDREQAYEVRRKAFDNILSSCGIPYEHRDTIIEAERDAINELEIVGGKVKNAHEIEQSIRSGYGGLVRKSVPGVSYYKNNPVSITSITDRNERMRARKWQNGITSG